MLDSKNRTIKYISLIVASMLGIANVIFNDYKYFREVVLIAIAIFIVNAIYDYYIAKKEIKDASSGVLLKIRVGIFFYTYIIGAYALFISGAFDNSSILMYFAIVVLVSIDFFGKNMGTLVLILTLMQGYVYYSVVITESSAWRILMTIASLSAAYAVGFYLESMKKNQVLLCRKINEVEMLFEISRLVDDFPGLDKVISEISKIIVEYMGVSECYIMIYDEKIEKLINRSTHTKEYKKYNSSIPKVLEAGDGFPGKVFVSGESIFCYGDSLKNLDCDSLIEREIKAFGIVAIKFHEQILGTITITSREDMSCSEQDEKLLKTIASRVAMVINSQKMFKELENASRKDSLTALYNHGYFYERLEYEISILENKKSIYVIMADLDKFKYINDIYGYVVGDKILIKIGETLNLMSRSEIICARYGGEEFSVIIKTENEEEVLQFSNTFREKVSMMYAVIDELKGEDIDLTVSIGLAKYIDDSIDSEELVCIADKRMYRAKELGGNRVINFDSKIN